MTSTRASFLPVTLGLAASGGAAWFIANRRWGSAAAIDETLPTAKAFVTGSEAAPLVTACAFVVVAAALALLVTGPLGRRIVAVVALMAASAGALVSARAPHDVERALARQVGESGTVHGWHWAALVVFVIAALLAVATWITSRDWPTMSARYDAPGASATRPEPETEADVWKAFDEGADPTE